MVEYKSAYILHTLLSGQSKEAFDPLKSLLEQIQGWVQRLDVQSSQKADYQTDNVLSKFLEWYRENSSRDQSFNILVIGETGSGKSTLINNMIGEPVAKVGMTLDSETSQIEVYRTVVAGVQVILYDTPGHHHSTGYKDESIDQRHLGEINSLITSNAMSLVIFCFKITETRRTPNMVDTFKAYNQIGISWRKTFVALTFADNLRDDKRLSTQIGMWKTEIRENILERELGVAAHIAAQIDFHPTTEHPSVSLSGQKEWYIPFWFAVLETLEPKAMIDFLMIHNKDLKNRKTSLNMGDNIRGFVLESFKNGHILRVMRILVQPAEYIGLTSDQPSTGEAPSNHLKQD